MKSKLLDFVLRPPQIGSAGPLELLVLQPTPFCNLNCDYCYLLDRGSTSRMKPDVIEAAFREVFRSGIVDQSFNVVWHAGEPMVVGIPFYEEMLRIVEGIKPPSVGVSHSFQTNATLMTDEWCEFIKKHHFKIGVSVDGPEFIHDLHRKTRSGAGTHKKVMAGIKLLQKHRIPFDTISVLTGEALGHPDEIFNFFFENGIRNVGFNVEEREGGHSSSSLEKAGTAERLTQFMSRIYDLNVTSGNRLNVREITRFERAVMGWSALRAKVLRFSGTQENAPFKIINVGWDGNFSTFSPELLGVDVAPYGKFTFGNVLTDTFSDVMKSKKIRDVALAIQNGIRKCENGCKYFSVCGGGSPANKIFENGTFDSSETMHCRLHVQTLAEVVLNKIETAASVEEG